MKKLIFLIGMLIFGCAGFQGNPDTSYEELINSINDEGIEALSAFLEVPFLLDSEIILVKQDLLTFWSQLKDKGFSLTKEGEAVPVDSYTFWGDSMDIRLFFKKYLPEKSYQGLASGNGGGWNLLYSIQKGKIRFHGIKGPVL